MRFVTIFFSLFRRYFILALQGTCQVSPIVKAQQLDKLPKEQWDREIKKWKATTQAASIEPAVPSDELAQSITNSETSTLAYAGADQMLSGIDGHQTTCPTEQEILEDWVLNEEGNDFTNGWAQEEGVAASFLSAKASPHSSGLLSSNTGSTVRGSHRRSVSAVTL